MPETASFGTVINLSLNIINMNFDLFIKINIMKKIILSAAFLALAGLTTVKANDILTPVTVAVQQDSTTKTPVELKDLPEPVVKTLQSDPVKAWTPTSAFLITNPDKTSHYLINLKKEEETNTLKIDKDGNIIQ